MSILARGYLVVLKSAFSTCGLEADLTNLKTCVDTDRFHTGDFDGPMSSKTDITETPRLVNRESKPREGTPSIQHRNVDRRLRVFNRGTQVQLSRVKNEALFRNFELKRWIVCPAVK